MEQTAGAILDGLGVKFNLDEGDLVANALVLAKVLCEDGSVSLVVGASEGITWLEQLGLVSAASDLIRPSRWRGSGGYSSTTFDDEDDPE